MLSFKLIYDSELSKIVPGAIEVVESKLYYSNTFIFHQSEVQ